MKISREKLTKTINSEIKAYLREMKGNFAKEMRQAAQSDAYKDHMANQNSGADTHAEAAKEKEFQKAHQAQLASKEGMPDWMLEEEEDDDFAPATSSELQSEKIYNLMWTPLKAYMEKTTTLSPDKIESVQYDVEEKMLDIAMFVRDLVKHKGR